MTYDDALHPAVEESETGKLESTRQNIGERLVETLKCTEGKGQIFWDTALKGFGVRVTASGVKSFILNYRIQGRQRRYTIGRYPDWSCEAAGKEAARPSIRIDEGFDLRSSYFRGIPLSARSGGRITFPRKCHLKAFSACAAAPGLGATRARSRSGKEWTVRSWFGAAPLSAAPGDPACGWICAVAAPVPAS